MKKLLGIYVIIFSSNYFPNLLKYCDINHIIIFLNIVFYTYCFLNNNIAILKIKPQIERSIFMNQATVNAFSSDFILISLALLIIFTSLCVYYFKPKNKK